MGKGLRVVQQGEDFLSDQIVSVSSGMVRVPEDAAKGIVADNVVVAVQTGFLLQYSIVGVEAQAFRVSQKLQEQSVETQPIELCIRVLLLNLFNLFAQEDIVLLG